MLRDHELLEDVVLDGAGKRCTRNALLLPRNDEIGEHGNDRAVHRHGHRDLIERNAVEQDFHVLDAIDRNARLSDIALHAWMVAVITAVGGEIESDGNALLAGGERLAVKGIGGFRGGETGILTDVQGRPAYMVARGPRVKGANPGRLLRWEHVAGRLPYRAA